MLPWIQQLASKLTKTYRIHIRPVIKVWMRIIFSENKSNVAFDSWNVENKYQNPNISQHGKKDKKKNLSDIFLYSFLFEILNDERKREHEKERAREREKKVFCKDFHAIQVLSIQPLNVSHEVRQELNKDYGNKLRFLGEFAKFVFGSD